MNLTLSFADFGLYGNMNRCVSLKFQFCYLHLQDSGLHYSLVCQNLYFIRQEEVPERKPVGSITWPRCVHLKYSHFWLGLLLTVCVWGGGGGFEEWRCFHTRARRQDKCWTCAFLWCLSHQTCRTWCERHHRNAQVHHLSCRCLALVWKHH